MGHRWGLNDPNDTRKQKSINVNNRLALRTEGKQHKKGKQGKKEEKKEEKMKEQEKGNIE